MPKYRLLQISILLLLVLSNISVVQAQLLKAEIGIDGLTCSMCSRSTEMSIRKLNFVDDVKMDLEKTTGEIKFKNGVEISFEKIAQAVLDAGFSVRHLSVLLETGTKTLHYGDCFTVDSIQFKYVGKSDTLISGISKLNLIGKGMMPLKQYKKWASELKVPCEAMKKTYFVSL